MQGYAEAELRNRCFSLCLPLLLLLCSRTGPKARAVARASCGRGSVWGFRQGGCENSEEAQLLLLQVQPCSMYVLKIERVRVPVRQGCGDAMMAERARPLCWVKERIAGRQKEM